MLCQINRAHGAAAQGAQQFVWPKAVTGNLFWQQIVDWTSDLRCLQHSPQRNLASRFRLQGIYAFLTQRFCKPFCLAFHFLSRAATFVAVVQMQYRRVKSIALQPPRKGLLNFASFEAILVRCDHVFSL